MAERKKKIYHVRLLMWEVVMLKLKTMDLLDDKTDNLDNGSIW